MELKKIGILSLGKIGGLMGIVAGIVAAIMLAISQKIMALIPAETGIEGLYSLTWKAALLMPLYYAIAGFIWGVAIAFLYNIFAKYVGGIKLEFKK